MKILLAVDGSKPSDAAVDAVTRHFGPDNCEVRVISVIEPPYVADTFSGGGVNPSLYVELEHVARERAQAAVDQAVAHLSATGDSRHRTVTAEILPGSPKRVILEDADAFGADWIVVGSHGYGALERFMLGSVSQAVMSHATCSVAVVRNPTTPAK